MEAQVLRSSWDLVLQLWLCGRLFFEKRLPQKDELRPECQTNFKCVMVSYFVLDGGAMIIRYVTIFYRRQRRTCLLNNIFQKKMKRNSAQEFVGNSFSLSLFFFW